MGIERAEKLVFVSSAAKMANKMLTSADELEQDFFCTHCQVDEAQFGTALADCVLIDKDEAEQVQYHI